MNAEMNTTTKQEVVLEYFCTENTVDEYHTEITGNYDSFNDAREALRHKSDWYCNDDTGRIYKCTFYREGDELKSKKELVFHRTQRDAVNNTPGTYYIIKAEAIHA